MIARLDEGGDVQRVALDTLGQLAMKGDVAAVAALTKSLIRSVDIDLVASTRLANSGLSFLGPIYARDRRELVTAIGKVAERRDAAAVAAVSARLADEDPDVRSAASTALQEISGEGTPALTA